MTILSPIVIFVLSPESSDEEFLNSLGIYGQQSIDLQRLILVVRQKQLFPKY